MTSPPDAKGMDVLDPMNTSLPPKWSIPFTVTLRSRNVTGAAIGAALREIESHCAESGQSPEDAFGSPVSYAESLTDLPVVPRMGNATNLGPSVLGLLGLMLVSPTVAAWRQGTAVAVSTGLIASLLVAITVITLISLPRVFRQGTLLGGLAALGFIATLMAPILWTSRAMHAPVVLCGVIAVASLFGSALWQQRTLQPDVITDPLAPSPTTDPRRWFTVITTWLFPLLALALAVLTWVFPGASR